MVALVIGVSLWTIGFTKSFAQIPPLPPIPNLPTFSPPSLPFLNSPYVLDVQGITKNTLDNTWNVGYSVPVNTIASQFLLQVNGTVLTGIPTPQILGGHLVFRVPNDVFGPAGTALIVLMAQNPFEIVATDMVLVLAQAFQPSQYVLNYDSIIKNPNGTWDVGYYIPPNTTASHFSLTVEGSDPLTNGIIEYGGLIFEVPEAFFTPGASLTLTLTNEMTNTVRAVNTVVVPEADPSPYILEQSQITLNTDGTWRVGYQVPPNTIASDFVLLVGTTGEVGGGIIVNTTMVFKVPGTMYSVVNTPSVFVLKNIKTGKLYHSNGTVTQGVIPTGPGYSGTYTGGLLMTFPPVDQNITQTNAVIKAHLRALINLPFVDVEYIWNKSDDPATSTKKQLIKIQGPIAMLAGTESDATMTFAGLSPGTAYTFVLKNNVTNSFSDPITFTTPTNPGEKAYIGYTDGIVDYQTSGLDDGTAGSGGVVDDISGTGIVPRCGRTPGEGIPKEQTIPCGYKDFLQLISNILKYAIIIMGPIIAILAMYFGMIIIWTGKIPDPTSEQMARLQAAKAGLVKVAIGIAIILSAWVLIATITRELGVKESYTLLDLFNGN